MTAACWKHWFSLQDLFEKIALKLLLLVRSFLWFCRSTCTSCKSAWLSSWSDIAWRSWVFLWTFWWWRLRWRGSTSRTTGRDIVGAVSQWSLQSYSNTVDGSCCWLGRRWCPAVPVILGRACLWALLGYFLVNAFIELLPLSLYTKDSAPWCSRWW